ncbi:sulfite exporter TauE/SafE family protein [Bacillus sp. JJ722]|uniref:sulfite exporter TauE/SafE family protein n=1 Tax=Bacillus sp. JJ722 TaxID=3122973 RepID=UPI0030003B35
MENWYMLVMIVVIASILQTSTGFGFSIVSLPFLFLIYQPHTAVQLNLILSLVISIIMIFKVNKEVDKAILFRLIKGSIIGIPLGTGISMYFDIEVLKIIVSLVILLLTACLLLKVKIQQTNNRDFLIGIISGMLTISIGMPGPPLLLYFSGAEKEKAMIRNTTLAYYLFIYFISLVVQIIIVGISKVVLYSSLVSIIPLLIGILLGQWIFTSINQKTFQITTNIILLFTGFYLLATSF